MLGLSRMRSAFIWVLIVASAISVPYSVYRLYGDYKDVYHGSAPSDLAETLVNRGATLTLVPVDARSRTVNNADKLEAGPMKITGIVLDQRDNPAILEYLDVLPDLKSFSLLKTNLQDLQLVRVLEQLPVKLASLTVNEVLSANQNEPFLPLVVRQFPDLKTLEIIDMPITDSDLKTLSGHPQLRHLDLSETKITDEGMKVIRDLQLLTLKIGETNVTTAGLRDIPQTVTVLALDGLEITDEDIDHIASSYPRLVRLNLQNTSIGDEAIPSLLQLKQLKQLQLKGTSITPAGLERLKLAFPNETKVQM